MSSMSVSNEYAAGFFDGEGTVSIVRQRNTHVLMVQVSNTHLRSLELLQGRWGGAVYPKRSLRPKKPCWTWTLRGRHAAKFLGDIVAHTVVKQAEIDVGLRFQETITGSPITTELRQVREALKFEMQALRA